MTPRSGAPADSAAQSSAARPRSARLAAAASVAALIGTAALPATAAESVGPADAAAAGAAGYEEQIVAVSGENGFPNYRIPAIVTLANGDLLMSYDGRPTAQDAPGPNSILQRRSTDGGKTWGPQTVIHAGKTDAPIEGYSDPSYLYDEEAGTLFNFHVFSKDTGFMNSEYGNDDADRKVMSAEVSISRDNGETWEHRSMTSVVKPDEVRGTFATSGHGIQIKNGPHKGRLVQQYAGQFRGGDIKAYSVFSDDHGKTWRMGEPVGKKMDENKVVELSDGTLMMNSRVHDTHSARWVAFSSDGGETWSEPELDHTLVDPRNNASIVRKNPDAEPGTRKSKELLFSNANHPTSRQNGSLRYSCDDGATWPVVKSFQSGATSYSDLTVRPDGSYGLVYEGADSTIRYASVDDDWLKPFCADFAEQKSVIHTGKKDMVRFKVTNSDDRPMPAGTATVHVDGVRSGEAKVPELAPGKTATVAVEVEAPASSAGVRRGEVRVSAGEFDLRGDLNLTVK